MREIHHTDGRVELDDATPLEKSPLYNPDLAPVKVKDRSWSTYNYAALWISMAHCITTYMLASGLIGAGMSWGQALFTILLGNSIVLVPILLNSHPGTKYGIPFPVFARAAYGVIGSNLPALMRAVVACGWFGIQCWIGGMAIHRFLTTLHRGWPTALGGPFKGGFLDGTTPTELLCFMLFWGINILIIFKGMDLLRRVENWAAPYVLVMTALLVGWAIYRVHGLGPIISQPGKYEWASPAFLKIFIPSLTGMIGYWATLSLNMPDFTRFGRSQREQMIGQVVALPSTMTIFAAMGVVITSASSVIYGKAIWDPVDLVSRFDSTAIVLVSMFTVAVATLSVNIAANVVSPANDFANAFPRLINFGRGGLITGIIGIAMRPWYLLANPEKYINEWLVGCSGALGSIAGVLIADYWLLRKTRLALADLYMDKGAYRYQRGWNPAGVLATLLGCAPVFIGHYAVPSLNFFFDYAWFASFFISAGAYLGLMALTGGTASQIASVETTTSATPAKSPGAAFLN